MKTVFIYALKCPDTGLIRYIGASGEPQKRFLVHLRDRAKNHRTNWIRNLRSANMKPVLVILDEVLDSEWQQWEVAYIEYFRDCGTELVNTTPGGEGAGGGTTHPMYGRHHKPASREAIGDAFRGKTLSLDHRTKISKSHLGKSVSSAERTRLQTLNVGRVFSSEVRARMSEARMGKHNPMFGKSHTPESKLKSRFTKSLNRILKICQPLE